MQYVLQLFDFLQLYGLDSPEKLISAVEEVTERATGEADLADEEVELKSLRPALDLIKEWRLDLEWRLNTGSLGAGRYPSAWVSLKICENKTPFKNIASYGKTGRDFIVIATIILESAFNSRWKLHNTEFNDAAYAFGVSAKSSLGQILH